MISDRTADPKVPGFSLFETDQSGVAGALVLAQGEVHVGGGGEKQLVFPMTSSSYDNLKQSSDWMASRHFELIRPKNFAQAKGQILLR